MHNDTIDLLRIPHCRLVCNITSIDMTSTNIIGFEIGNVVAYDKSLGATQFKLHNEPDLRYYSSHNEPLMFL